MMGASPGRNVTDAAHALVVLEQGPARAAVVRTLQGLGLAVTTASDPYEATALFAETSPPLVVLSVAGWRRRDLAFLSAIRSRSLATALLLLVPPERRALAALALESGADAWLPEPVDLRELRAQAARCLRRAGLSSALPATSSASLRRLAAEVGHAINNPLQVLNLLLEETGAKDRAARDADLRREAARIRDAVEFVTSYGRLGEPARAPTSIGALLDERLATGERAGMWRRAGKPPRIEAMASLDADQARAAIDAMLRFAASRSDVATPTVGAAARRVAERDRAFAEAAVRVRGVHVPAGDWDEVVKSVLFTDENTRRAYPGLALPLAVAEAHGGGLRMRETPPGTVLAIRFPAA
jgi:DNA-binding response OmpR family regulator